MFPKVTNSLPLVEALARLPEQQRTIAEAVLSAFMEGMSVQERLARERAEMKSA